mgnify:CR=1 FL=1
MEKNKTMIWVIIIGIIAAIFIFGQLGGKDIKKSAGETVSWSAASAYISTGGTLTITASPSSTAAIKSWAVENVAIPSGWTLQSAVFSGGSGLGASGCRVESGKLDCATAGSAPADVATTLIVKFGTPNSISSGTLSGMFTTMDINDGVNRGQLKKISLNGGGTNTVPSSNSGYIFVVAAILLVIFFMSKRK